LIDHLHGVAVEDSPSSGGHDLQGYDVQECVDQCSTPGIHKRGLSSTPSPTEDPIFTLTEARRQAVPPDK